MCSLSLSPLFLNLGIEKGVFCTVFCILFYLSISCTYPLGIRSWKGRGEGSLCMTFPNQLTILFMFVFTTAPAQGLWFGVHCENLQDLADEDSIPGRFPRHWWFFGKQLHIWLSFIGNLKLLTSDPHILTPHLAWSL